MPRRFPLAVLGVEVPAKLRTPRCAMRILALSNCLLDHASGSGRTRLAWADGLRALGHEVTTVESIELLGGSEGAPAGRRLRMVRGAWRWLRRHRPRRYDVVEFYGAEFWLATWWLSRQPERPLLVAHTDGLEMLAEERLRPLRPDGAAAGRWGKTVGALGGATNQWPDGATGFFARGRVCDRQRGGSPVRDRASPSNAGRRAGRSARAGGSLPGFALGEIRARTKWRSSLRGWTARAPLFSRP